MSHKHKNLTGPHTYKAKKSAAPVQHFLVQAVSFHQKGEFAKAKTFYRQVLSRQPDNFDALHLLGVIAAQTRYSNQAVELIGKAIEINSNSADAYYNYGNALQYVNRHLAAVDSYYHALALNPDYVDVYCSLGLAFNHLKQDQTALENYDRAFALDPDYDFLCGYRLHTKMKLCNWQNLEQECAVLTAKLAAGGKAAQPFTALTLLDSPELQKKVAQLWTQDKSPGNDSLPKLAKQPRRARLRIGYFSADFQLHPVAMLTAELFEKHHRSGFEIIAFSLNDSGPKDQTRIRLEAGFDRFLDVQNLSDLEIAQLARKLEIDIAVDLGGHTGKCRTGIFALRAAPIQISYIGYLGTMGAAYMDYLIADPVIIPEQARPYYQEKIVYLPSYQVNDSQRRIADVTFTRSQLGLPETGFVFCCFNNNYKITPNVFSQWMRILASVPGSVLFLYAGNAAAEQNLKNAAVLRGVNPDRLVFGKKLPLPEYLARYRQADLFLDTQPYNAGTTASDALWTGLPVLTCLGNTFAGRVAASLLTAIDLPELIAQTPAQYEAMAIDLATCPDKLAGIKARLSQNRLTTPLFNTDLFTANLEAAYIRMYERYQADLPPEHIYV